MILSKKLRQNCLEDYCRHYTKIWCINHKTKHFFLFRNRLHRFNCSSFSFSETFVVFVCLIFVLRTSPDVAIISHVICMKFHLFDTYSYTTAIFSVINITVTDSQGWDLDSFSCVNWLWKCHCWSYFSHSCIYQLVICSVFNNKQIFKLCTNINIIKSFYTILNTIYLVVLILWIKSE